MASPRIEIDLQKISHNVKTLLNHFASKGIAIIGVTKGVGGNTDIAKTLIKSGIKILADSRIQNIKKMKCAGISVPFILLRTPLKSELEEVLDNCYISHNTEYSIIENLSELASKRGLIHKIILMVELGDLRDGITPSQLPGMVAKVQKLEGVEIVGIGTNLACFAGVKPDHINMGKLSDLATDMEKVLGYKLMYISGGNSANYDWMVQTNNVRNINYMRLGESIYLGCNALTRIPIPGLYTNAFTLVAEVIESGTKPSVPTGEIFQNAFGEKLHFEDKGMLKRVILGIGKQDVDPSGLKPRMDFQIIGSGSDHLIIDTKNTAIEVGKELKFDLNYSSLLAGMTSSYVVKTKLIPLKQNEFSRIL